MKRRSAKKLVLAKARYIRNYTKQHRIAVLVISGVVLVGVLIALAASGQGPFSSSEPELGTVTGGATIITDSEASGGQGIKFGASQPTSGHPFLITRRSEFPTWQARAAQTPWSGMKARAQADCDTLAFLTDGTTKDKGTRYRDIMGACSLMYILDPANKAAYLAKLHAGFTGWPALFNQMKADYVNSSNRWVQVVPPSSAFFNSVIALDTVYDDLTAAQRTTYENSLDAVAEWFWVEDRSWGTATYGVRAVWATYQNDTARRSTALTQYRNQYLEWLTSDGVFFQGPEYALARYGGDRPAKSNFMHVAEYTGVDRSYYNNTTVKGFYEWLLSFAYGPFNGMSGFGDSGPLGNQMSTFYPQGIVFNAGKVSAAAAGYAQYRQAVGISKMPSDLVDYVTATPPVTAQVPKSRAWKQGGAAFWENNATKDALKGDLWNTTKSDGHSHKDVNAVYLTGYGENLLMNSGYNGAGNDALGASWESINNFAESSNTVLLGAADHATKTGDGISESLVGNGLDYASGTGDAIFPGAAKHVRNFIMVHPQDGVHGYFVNADEVTGASAGQLAKLVYHPASANVATVQSGAEYKWTVRIRKTTDTFLSIFLGKAPTSLSLEDGVIAGWTRGMVGKYMNARFETNTSGNNRFISVMFPHDSTHAKANFARIAPAGATGATITQGQSVDYALESGGADVSTGGAGFRAGAVVFRRIGTETKFYFARSSTKFDAGNGQGFTSDLPVSIQMRDRSGSITASEARIVTFRYPGIASVTIDGQSVTGTPVIGGIQVNLTAGTHAIRL